MFPSSADSSRRSRERAAAVRAHREGHVHHGSDTQLTDGRSDCGGLRAARRRCHSNRPVAHLRAFAFRASSLFLSSSRSAMASVAAAGLQHCAHVVRLQIRVRIDAAPTGQSRPRPALRIPPHPAQLLRRRGRSTPSTPSTSAGPPLPSPSAPPAVSPPFRFLSLFFPSRRSLPFVCSCLLHLFCGTLLSFVHNGATVGKFCQHAYI